jgi:nitroreductase
VENSTLIYIQKFLSEFSPYPETRAVLVNQATDEIFKGAIGNLGKIKGAPAFIAFVGNIDDPNIQEKVGYLGEGVILEATASNLATCWVGGFFRPEIASLLPGAGKKERVLVVTPIGYTREGLSFEEKIMAGFGRNHQRKPLAELVSGLEETNWPGGVKKALEAARLAPSAVNRQPWRFEVQADNITVAVDNLNDSYNISKRLDCGIAMLHIEVAALDSMMKGQWEFLEPPEVARFIFTEGFEPGARLDAPR